MDSADLWGTELWQKGMEMGRDIFLCLDYFGLLQSLA